MKSKKIQLSEKHSFVNIGGNEISVDTMNIETAGQGLESSMGCGDNGTSVRQQVMCSYVCL